MFENGPLIGPFRRLGAGWLGTGRVARPMLAVVLIGWLPIGLLTLLDSRGDALATFRDFLSDASVHARFLAAAPLLVGAETLCSKRLDVTVRHFLGSGIVARDATGPFEEAVRSARRLIGLRLADGALLAIAYGLALALKLNAPAEVLPSWHLGADGAYSPAGRWHAFVSTPLLILLLIAWLWRIGLWTRFLRIVSTLDLRLIAAHPDKVAGLSFVGHSIRAFAPVALAMSAIVAGRVANGVLHRGASLHDYWPMIAGVVVVSLLLFAGPLLMFSGRLKSVWRVGILEYGALADRMGRRFERHWFTHHEARDDGMLESPSFSATTDLYQIVSNVYGMRFVPLDLQSLVMLLVVTLLPFVPVALLSVPLAELIKDLQKLLF